MHARAKDDLKLFKEEYRNVTKLMNDISSMAMHHDTITGTSPKRVIYSFIS